jgi:hypothetical protein
MLGRRFDVAFCLEVGEHLNETAAPVLVSALVAHTDVIWFSAAIPGQVGQHHVNCRWPDYWQSLFNEAGFACSDAIRWRLWDDERIEPWYRQNLFLATRDEALAGLEPRIQRVVHPVMWNGASAANHYLDYKTAMEKCERGLMPATWYLTLPWKAFVSKCGRRFRRPDPRVVVG